MAVSGQIPESYMVLRGILENALYGFYISVHPELLKIWLLRHDNAKSLRAVKKMFQIGLILDNLALANAGIGDITRTLYEQTIDSGAHPNEQSIMQVLDIEHEDDQVNFEIRYLSGADEPAFEACLKTTARVGVCALDIFRIVFYERYKILGLTQELDNLKRDL